MFSFLEAKMFELFPRGKSYPLTEALLRYGNQELARWLAENNSNDAADLPVRYEKQNALLKSLNYGIRTGALRATAFQLPITISSKREEISADVWEKLSVNVDQGTAEFQGLRLYDIEIAEDAISMRIWGLGPRSYSSESEDAVEDEEDEAEVTLSEDGELLTIGDARWRFTGEIQQEIIRQLVEAYPGELRTAEVLAHAGSNQDTIPKAFNGSRHWSTLSLYIFREEGMCRLLNKPQEVDPETSSLTNDTSEAR
jgi:hypothetical protein